MSLSNEDLEIEDIKHSNVGVVKIIRELNAKRQFFTKNEIIRILKQLVKYSFYSASHTYEVYFGSTKVSGCFLEIVVKKDNGAILYRISRGSSIRVTTEVLTSDNFMTDPKIRGRGFYPISCTIPSLLFEKVVYSLNTSISNDDIFELFTNISWTHGCWIELLRYFGSMDIDASGNLQMQAIMVGGSLLIPRENVTVDFVDLKGIEISEESCPYDVYCLKADELDHSGRIILTYR